MAVRSIIIENNPVTQWEDYLLNCVPRDSVGRAEAYFDSYAPDDRAEGGDGHGVTFRIYGRSNVLKEMYQNGLGRHVEAWGYGLQQDIEGQIYELVYNVPPHRYEKSLENVINRIKMRVDYDDDGVVERSTVKTNADSQAQFGIKERVLSGGELTSLAVADQAVQTFLDLRGFPLSSPKFGQGRGEEYLEIFVRNYGDTLNWRVWNQTTDTSTEGVSTQISDIIGDRASTRIILPSTWDQAANLEDGRPTDFDSLSPAWDHTVLEGVGDFDSETDADGDLNTSASAAKLGTNGCEVTFDDANIAYGQIDATAVDRTEGVLHTYFNANSVGLADGKVINIFNFEGGASQPNWWARLEGGTGTYALQFIHRTDTGLAFTATPSIPDSDWIDIFYVFRASSGVGNDDGFVYIYLYDSTNGLRTFSVTGIDNDTLDWDNLKCGMAGTDQASGFSGSYYFDEVRVAEFVSPVWITKAAALSGSYGMAVTIEDTTARYGSLTDPAAETEITVECRIDPDGLTMATDDVLTFIHCNGELKVELPYDGTNFEVRATANLDSGTTATARYDISNAPHIIRAVLGISSGVGNDDGFLHLFCDNNLLESITDLDNDTLSVDEVRYGAMDLDSGTSGLLKIDSPRWSNDSVVTTTAESGIAQFIASKDIDSNATLVYEEHNADRRARDIVSSDAGLGDAENNRWLWYMRGKTVTDRVGREFVYEQASPSQRSE